MADRSANAERTEIRGGVEWFTVETARGPEEDCQCARCGSSVEWVRCGNCVDGFSHHDCGEDTCCCADPEDNVWCDWCGGAGGSWHCVSSPEWCQANAMPGREHIDSTAMSSEAWRDA